METLLRDCRVDATAWTAFVRISSSAADSLTAKTTSACLMTPAITRHIGSRSEAEGMAKRGDEWFPLTQAVVAYDHARHAPLGDVITLDFVNTALDPGARAGVELTLETAIELRAALDRAIAAAEFEEAEVRGKGVVLSFARTG